MTRPTARATRLGWNGLLPWLAVALALQAVFVLSRDIALVGGPPLGTAEGTLLQQVYGLAERWSALGWLGFWQGLPIGGQGPSPALVLGSLVEVYGGGGRLALLLPGLALLLAAEVAFAAAALRLTRSPGLTAFGAGLLLLRTRPWLAETGLFTVNADWLAATAFGLAASLMIAVPIRHRVAVALACPALGLVILGLGPTTFACLLVVAALRLAWGGDLVASRRLAGLASLSLVAVAAGLLWAAAPCPPVAEAGIRLDHGRAAACGYGLRTSVLHLASFGLGLPFVAAAAAALLGAVATARGFGPAGARALRLRRVPLRGEAGFLIAVLIALAGIQMTQRSADPIGAGLADVPLTALILAGLAGLARRRSGALRLAGFGVLALSTVLPWGSPRIGAPSGGPRPAGARAASWLIRDAEATGRRQARILVDPRLSIADGPGLSAFFYETFGEPAAFSVESGAGDVGGFDYAVLPAATADTPAGAAVLRRIESVLIARTRLDLGGRDVTIFSAPDVSVAGVSGGWLLATGTSLSFDAAEIPRGSVIALRGPDGFARFVPDPPDVTAVATTRQGATLTLPARFLRQGETYAIFVDPAAIATGRVEIALDFSRFFVPKDIGMNPDPRRLAVMAPTSVGLVPRADAFDAAQGAP